MKTYGYSLLHSDADVDAFCAQLQEVLIPNERIYIDREYSHFSGFRLLSEKIVFGEASQIYIKTLESLGDNYEQILEHWNLLTKECGASVIVMDMPGLDTRKSPEDCPNLVAELVASMIKTCRDIERKKNSSRAKKGVANVRARGDRYGRQKIPLPANFDDIKKQLHEGTMTMDQATLQCGMSRATLWRRLREFEVDKNNVN